MRRRLLTSTLTIVIATIAVFGIPLAFVLDRVVHDDAQARLARDGERVATEYAKLDDGTRSPDELVADLHRLVRSEYRITLNMPNGHVVSSGPPANRHALLTTEPAARGAQVTLVAPADDVDTQVQHVLLIVMLVSVVALVGALVLALWQSTRLTSPLKRLARSASRLGEGDFSHVAPRSGVDEIDEIADSLDASAQRVDALLQAERDFSSHASHQLRSALTGLQLRLEELAANDDPEVRAEAEAALEQSARLNATVDELLALARTGRTGIVTTFDLADLATQHAADIRPVLSRSGRRINVDSDEPVAVVGAIGAVGQAVDILLSNAARHGAGTVTVRVRANGRHAQLDVEDEGRGISDVDVEGIFDLRDRGNGHGIGLALAASVDHDRRRHDRAHARASAPLSRRAPRRD